MKKPTQQDEISTSSDKNSPLKVDYLNVERDIDEDSEVEDMTSVTDNSDQDKKDKSINDDNEEDSGDKEESPKTSNPKSSSVIKRNSVLETIDAVVNVAGKDPQEAESVLASKKTKKRKLASDTETSPTAEKENISQPDKKSKNLLAAFIARGSKKAESSAGYKGESQDSVKANNPESNVPSDSPNENTCKTGKPNKSSDDSESSNSFTVVEDTNKNKTSPTESISNDDESGDESLVPDVSTASDETSDNSKVDKDSEDEEKEASTNPKLSNDKEDASKTYDSPRAVKNKVAGTRTKDKKMKTTDSVQNISNNSSVTDSPQASIKDVHTKLTPKALAKLEEKKKKEELRLKEKEDKVKQKQDEKAKKEEARLKAKEEKKAELEKIRKEKEEAKDEVRKKKQEELE